jgi:hypothetical protein
VLPSPYVYGDPWHAQVWPLGQSLLPAQLSHVHPHPAVPMVAVHRPFIPASPQSPSLEHAHWDGCIEVGQSPLQEQVPAGAGCVHSMSLARWFVGTRPRIAPSEGAEPDWLLHAAKPARRSPTPHVDILNVESST